MLARSEVSMRRPVRDARSWSRALWLRALLVAPLLVAAPLGCAADVRDDGRLVDPVTEELGQTSQAITADSIMARAKQWVAEKVLYCAVSNNKWDSVCGYQCERPKAAWDAYRSDCSGYVSWCWQIASQPSSRTYMVDKAGTDGWKTIPIDALAPGDALVCNGHIMLFSRWVSATSFEIYQESNCGKVANFGTRTFKRNADGTLMIGSDTRVYHPIRRNGLTAPTPDAGAPDAAKPDVDKPDVGSDGGAVADAGLEAAVADAAPTDPGLPDDAGAPDPGAQPDDGELPGDDGPPGAALTGSCGVGGRGAALGWLGGALLALAASARFVRRARASERRP
jgi:hypothetical protein